MSDISSRLADIRKRIETTCQHCARDPAEVHLLAVSKTKPISLVEEAHRAGQQDFGENYLQDALPKTQGLASATWHFIGAIQSNKTRDIANHFDWVHSVSSEKVARRLSEQRAPELGPLKVLIQVNTSQEHQKSGVNPDKALSIARFVAEQQNLEPAGLMTIPAASADAELQRQPFKVLRETRDHIRDTTGIEGFQHLSMGMTGDFEVAITEGATWIRIGTAIFGSRS